MVGFSQFIRERQYLTNVSPSTLEWYKHSFKWLRTEAPAQDELKDAVLRMREKGLKATGCNSAIRAINAYLKWSGSPLKIPQLKSLSLSCRHSPLCKCEVSSVGNLVAFTSVGCICLCSFCSTPDVGSLKL
jgi:hypothetical protein